MKKIFRLEGLDCANCAANIERAISKVDGVSVVSVNFMTTKLTYEVSEEKDEAIQKAIEAVIKKAEPDVVMKKS